MGRNFKEMAEKSSRFFDALVDTSLLGVVKLDEFLRSTWKIRGEVPFF